MCINARISGVLIEFEAEDQDTDIMVDGFYRLSHGIPGVGKIVMRIVCELADENCCRISLVADKGTYGLVKYYEEFGFEVIGRNPLGAEMRRMPRRKIGRSEVSKVVNEFTEADQMTAYKISNKLNSNLDITYSLLSQLYQREMVDRKSVPKPEGGFVFIYFKKT